MRETGRCAVAKYAARGKQYLVLLRPFGEGLVMQQLLYADEIRDFGEVPIGEDVALKEAEISLAIQLIEQIASDEFDASKYDDDVRERVMAAIQQKVEGQEVVATVDEAPKAQIIDLMEALKASLGGSRRARRIRQAVRARGRDHQGRRSRRGRGRAQAGPPRAARGQARPPSRRGSNGMVVDSCGREPSRR